MHAFIMLLDCAESLTTLPLPSLQALRLPESGSRLPAKLIGWLLQCAASVTCPSLQALGLPEFLKQKNAELVVTADKDGPNCGAFLGLNASLRLSNRLDESLMPLPFPCAHASNMPTLCCRSLDTCSLDTHSLGASPQRDSSGLTLLATHAHPSAPVCCCIHGLCQLQAGILPHVLPCMRLPQHLCCCRC